MIYALCDYDLLQKYNIKVILAVPTKFILDNTNEKDEDRLNILHDDTYSNIHKAPFCTFEELLPFASVS